MELKHDRSLDVFYIKNNFNRTNMELKHFIDERQDKIVWILIAPIWN